MVFVFLKYDEMMYIFTLDQVDYIQCSTDYNYSETKT